MSMKDHQNADGTYNGPAVLSELTGMNRDDVITIFGEVKANQARLDACPYHEFEWNPAVPESVVMSRHNAYLCKHCNGYISPERYRWFMLGREQKK